MRTNAPYFIGLLDFTFTILLVLAGAQWVKGYFNLKQNCEWQADWTNASMNNDNTYSSQKINLNKPSDRSTLYKSSMDL